MTECGVSDDLTIMAPQLLNQRLERFYAAVRKEDGEYYKLNSMRSVRSSIQRRYLEKCSVDIIDDIRFKTSNNTFNNICKRIKASGKGDTEHYPEMEPEDIRRLCAFYSTTTTTATNL